MNDFIIKSRSGKFSKLDKEYNRFLMNKITNEENDKINRWNTYNAVIFELIEIKMDSLFDEIKYRITDGENPNIVMLNIISRVKDKTTQLDRLEKKIVTYLDEDRYNKFYK